MHLIYMPRTMLTHHKELPQPARLLTHRPSISNAANAAGSSTLTSATLTTRQAHSRNSSHSIIGTTLNPNHRVSRRKSMTSTSTTNVAAMTAFLQEQEADGKGGVATAAATVAKLSSGGFQPATSAMAAAMSATSAQGVVGSLPLPSPPASLPTGKFVTADGSAIDDASYPSDGDDDLTVPTGVPGSAAFDMSRIRRASDGQPLMKEGRRSINRMELRCDKCGKGYKHSSCLTKHLWEHTPEWSYTSKLLISKHQQVQLLEAASVLVAMNNKVKDPMDPAMTTPPDSARDFGSERDSASPAASGYSEPNDGRGSADTTPPPFQLDGAMKIEGIQAKREASGLFSSPPPPAPAPHFGSDYRSFSDRLGSGGSTASAFSRSYQSTLPLGNSIGAGRTFGPLHQRENSQENIRPPSSGRNMTGQEDNELAAAVELLSCSFNSNGSKSDKAVIVGSLHGGLPQDIPPVPPVPAQYLGQTPTPLGDTSFINSFPDAGAESFTRGDHRGSIADDVKMEDSGDSVMDDDDDVRSRGRSDDDDDGVFGRMEE